MFAAGGLTIPAMCPDPDSTNFVSPFMIPVPVYVVFHGAMWSSMADTKYVGTLTFERSMGTPASVTPPGSRSRLCMYMLRR